MRILITGSAGHLGESLMRSLQDSRHQAVGIDILNSPFTAQVGSITDRAFVARCMEGVEAVLHASSLHKSHIATHSRQDFVDINIIGTLNLLEQAVRVGVRSFVFTSTTRASASSQSKRRVVLGGMVPDVHRDPCHLSIHMPKD